MVGTPNAAADPFHSALAYALCTLLIVIYAWERFNTPPENRSSTRQLLYWQSCVGYILSALVLFGALSLLLEQPVWRGLLGLNEHQSLPAPLVATLAMTTLLPRVPLLSRLDRGLLDLFLDWGAIPAEVKRRAAALTPHGFTVSADDIRALADGCEGLYGESFASHLREHGVAGLDRARLRFTRMVKLYVEIQQLASAPRYSRFFDQHADEFASLGNEVEGFIRKAVAELDLAARLHALPDASYQDVAHERQQNFAEECRQRFILMTRFLARAVLRSETSERDIVGRLHQIGFPGAEPMTAPVFPINSLTALALGVFAYLTLTGYLFSSLVAGAASGSGGPVMPSAFAIAAKITLVRVSTLALCVWLMQRYDFFRRSPGEAPRYFAYLVNGLAAAALAVLAGIGLHLFDGDLLAGLRQEAPLVLLSLMLCTAVAFCCDDWADEATPPRWLRPVEAVGCGAAMALGMAIVNAAELTPLHPSGGWLLVAFIGLPAALGMIVGGCVPHIYRETRRTAAARQREAGSTATALRPAAPDAAAVAAELPPPALPRHAPAAARGGLAARAVTSRRAG